MGTNEKVLEDDQDDLKNKDTLYISQMGKIGKDLKFLKRRQEGLNLKFLQFGADAELLYSFSHNVNYAYNSSSDKEDISDFNVVNLRGYFLVSPASWIFATGTYRLNTNETTREMFESAYDPDLDRWQDLFFTIGDFNKLPYYVTIGRQYIPFGNFRKLSAYTNPLTKIIFRMNDSAVTLGRQKDKLNTVLSFYNAENDQLSFAIQNNYEFSYAKIDYAKIGAGFTSNMAGMTYYIDNYVDNNGNETLPAIDIFAEWKMGPYAFKAEFNQTLVESQNNQRFGAFDLEGQYAFHFIKPSAVSLAYSQLYNADNIFDSAVPEKQWIGSYKLRLFSHTFLGFEYVRAITFANEKYNIFNIDLTIKL